MSKETIKLLYDRRYREAHREKINARQRQRYKENRESSGRHIKRRGRKYCEAYQGETLIMQRACVPVKLEDDIMCAFMTGKTSEERGRKECDE